MPKGRRRTCLFSPVLVAPRGLDIALCHIDQAACKILLSRSNVQAGRAGGSAAWRNVRSDDCSRVCRDNSCRICVVAPNHSVEKTTIKLIWHHARPRPASATAPLRTGRTGAAQGQTHARPPGQEYNRAAPEQPRLHGGPVRKAKARQRCWRVHTAELSKFYMDMASKLLTLHLHR